MSDAQPGAESPTATDDDVLLRVEGLTKYFANESGLIESLSFDLSNPRKPVSIDRTWVKAVDDVSFEIRRGETFGLVGESGCGKSTLARTILNLLEPTEGAVYLDGENIADLSKRALRRRRQDIQMVFQDPQSSLNPRMKVGEIITAPMKAHRLHTKSERRERAFKLLEMVGLESDHYYRYPHEFSGGQRQRVNLARALSVDPDFIVCDEPVSALDVSIQAQILNTMKRLQDELGLTYLFIAHDLSVVRYISDRVGVMYLGELVEIAETQELYENPQHPYTRSLLNALPHPDPDRTDERMILEGEVPSPTDPPSGCRFRTRCPELIKPASFELSPADWDTLLSFIRAVRRRLIDPTLERHEIDQVYFEGTSLPEDIEDIVQVAIDHLAEDDFDAAQRILEDRIEAVSICAQEQPAYEVPPQYGSDPHFSACHLARDEFAD